MLFHESKILSALLLPPMAESQSYRLSSFAVDRIAHPLTIALKRIRLVKEILIQKNGTRISEGSFNKLDIVSENLSQRKILTDVIYVETVYYDVLSELQEKHMFVCLEAAVAQGLLEQEAKSEYIALYHGRKWKQRQYDKTDKIDNLKELIIQTENEIKDMLANKETEICKLEDAIQESKQANPQWIGYEEKLAEVRRENMKFRLEEQEEDIQNDLAKLNIDLPEENKCHDTVMYYLDKSCERLNAKLQQWKETHLTDCEEMETKLEKWQVRLNLCY